MVEGIAGIDPEDGLVYVTGTLDGPLERHLYRCSLFDDSLSPAKLTTGEVRRPHTRTLS